MCRPPLYTGLDILTEDSEHTDIDNDSTHRMDATVSLGGPDTLKTKYVINKTD